MKVSRIVGLIVLAWLILAVLVAGVSSIVWIMEVNTILDEVQVADPSVLYTAGSLVAPLFIIYGTIALVCLLGWWFWIVLEDALDNKESNDTDPKKETTSEKFKASEKETAVKKPEFVRISVADIQNEFCRQGMPPGEAAVRAEAAFPQRIVQLLAEGWEILISGDGAAYLRKQ